MADTDRTTWCLAFAEKLLELRPHLSHKLAMTITANAFPAGGDAAAAAKRYNETLGGGAAKPPRKPKR